LEGGGFGDCNFGVQLDFVTYYIYPAVSGFFWFVFTPRFFPFPFLSFPVSITADWFSKQGEVASQFSHFGVSFLHSAEHGMLGVYQGDATATWDWVWLSGLGGI